MLASASMKNINNAKNDNDHHAVSNKSSAGTRSDTDLLALINVGRARLCLWGIPEDQLLE